MAEMPERRRVARITVPWHLDGSVQKSREVRILDVSTGGVRIEHVESLRPGASCSLDLPPALGSLQLTARVVWSLVTGGEQTLEGERRLHYQSGLAFIGVTGDQHAVLADAIQKFPESGPTMGRKPPA